ncbi:MAG: alpha/beta hydrolase [Steroidobacteraceae bacterium]
MSEDEPPQRQGLLRRAAGGRSLALQLLAVAFVFLSARASATAAAMRVDLRPLDAARHTVALPDGITLGYVQLGDPRGVPVVLIHGYTDSDLDWAPLVPYLSPQLRLVLIDLRGHGVSSKPECCYTRLDFAYDVKLLLDALGIQRADIVGHSLGSMIAQTFAEYWPQRTARVVLISSTGGPPPGSGPRKPEFDYAAAIRRLKEPIDPDSAFMKEWWASPKPVDPEYLRRQRVNAAAIPLEVWLAVLDQGLVDSDLQRTLPRLRAPTLLIWGGADPIMEPAVRWTLRRALPRAKVVIFPGLGHNPFWEDPRACAAVINKFLAPGTRVARYSAAG